jgi:hypothetical protein
MEALREILLNGFSDHPAALAGHLTPRQVE